MRHWSDTGRIIILAHRLALPAHTPFAPLIPTLQLAKAFFQLDMPVLTRLCRESALAQMKAVSAAR